MQNLIFQLHPSWLNQLKPEFDQTYMQNLLAFLNQEKANGKVIYPAEDEIFGALNATPFDKVKVVILGQDPYHGIGQAHGLSFSVPKEIKIPPSLQNIFKEIQADLGLICLNHGNLTQWTDQGVLLLNCILTVEHARAASHHGKGWEKFTDTIISLLNDNCQNIVFLLWGSYAQNKGKDIDNNKHLVLTAPHPSPLSAYRGFLDCKHFSQCNHYLEQHAKTSIDWSVH